MSWLEVFFSLIDYCRVNAFYQALTSLAQPNSTSCEYSHSERIQHWIISIHTVSYDYVPLFPWCLSALHLPILVSCLSETVMPAYLTQIILFTIPSSLLPSFVYWLCLQCGLISYKQYQQWGATDSLGATDPDGPLILVPDDKWMWMEQQHRKTELLKENFFIVPLCPP